LNKVLAIRYGLRCFTCGLLSLVPVLGIAFALLAVFFYTKASNHAPEDWHVARRYAVVGMMIAALGLLLNFTAIVWIGVKLAGENM
jgi:hypothetical protein